MPLANRSRSRWPWISGLVILMAAAAGVVQGATPKAPEGFRVRLVAAVPAVKFPSQVATAPDGSLFVAEDPMDQVGPADQPINSILLFRPGQDPVVFAEGLSAVFGMLWHDDSLYVMNMPNLTVLRDTDGDGKADDRKELFKDLGVPAGFPNMLNDHIVSGLQLGIDGRLYVSVGDKGVPKATGPDGRTVRLRGGGILRCRPDGTELEVYSSGTRNHLEPNLDARDNLFTYDNTDDGLGWWTRVTHHVDGGYYGYPYDYHDRTDRILPRMAEYGGGSPCGGIVYSEDAWPEKYRGMVFWAEWGKRAVRAFRFEPDGASFRVGEAIDFLTPGEEGDDFRPIDLALSHDGKTLYVADWSMGGWGNKKEKLGRIYAVTYDGPEPINPRPRGSNSDPTPQLIASLNHPSLNERKRAQAELVKRGPKVWDETTAALADPETPALAKRHLVWTVAAIAEADHKGAAPIIGALKDPSADVRAQAARALGLARESDPKAVSALIPLLRDPEPATRLQAVIALGRIGDSRAIEHVIPIVADPDVYLSHSARAALTRIGDWPAIAKGLDSTDAKVRAGILLTLERVYDKEAVGALLAFAGSGDRDSLERAAAIQYLASVYRQAPPWDGKWWGTQPAKGKAPGKTVDWSETPVIREAIRRLLSDPAPGARIASAAALSEIGDEGAAARLRALFQKETDPEVRSAFARMFGGVRDREALPLLAAALRDSEAPGSVRDAAFEAVRAIGGPGATSILLDVLTTPNLSVDRQKEVIAALGQFQAGAAIPALIQSLGNASPDVREAAVAAIGAVLGSIQKTADDAPTARSTAVNALAAFGLVQKSSPDEALKALRGRLEDPSATVRKRAVEALGALKDRESIPALIAAADREETRREAAIALTETPDPRALSVYLRAMSDKSPELRRRAGAAVAEIRDQVVPTLNQLAKRGELPPSALPGLREAFGSAGDPGAADYAFLKAPAAERFDPDRYRAAALKGGGNPERGRALFADPNGLACLKCHAVAGEGGAVGPELSSVGAKYPREELIASVLLPSEKISSGYEPIVLALDDGRVVTGILKSETDDVIEIQDADAQTIRLDKEQVEDRKQSNVSIMPPGLAEGLAPADFADLIAYLETLKDAPAEREGK